MSTTKTKQFNHVEYRWSDQDAPTDDDVQLLVYRSNILGQDGRITNTGGGNTSSKIAETDPLTGETVDVLWVKGSGGDLRTAQRENFASLYQQRLFDLQKIYAAAPNSGAKTPIEDKMVGLYAHCTYGLNPRASSIDTPLHAFIPFRHVDHTHPNSVIAVAACKRQRELTAEIFGDDVVWTPWLRPGFELGLTLQRIWQQHPNCRGVVLGQHGLINGSDDPKECYELSLELIEQAARYIEANDRGPDTFGGESVAALSDQRRHEVLVELLPWLRGRLSQRARVIATVQQDETMLRFVCSVDAPRLAELGTSCPDHFLRTKIKPLFVPWNPHVQTMDDLRAMLDAGLAQYRQDYAAYYERCRHPDSPAMRDPSPSVILIPGVGMIAWGKNKSESRVTAEFYNCAVEVIRGAEAIDQYVSLPEQEAFDIEYWLLEEAKLRRMPPERPLARRIVLVVGAGSGIGKTTAHRLAAEGAHVICADLDGQAAADTANELTAKWGHGIGVAGSGISGAGPAIGLPIDITSRESIRHCLQQSLLAYGGLDHLVVTAGLYVSPDAEGNIPDPAWHDTFNVNVTGVYLVADEAKKIWQAQGLRGSMVVTTSVNAVVSKRGSFAYDASKAAANHLVRELAIELAPQIRVNAVAPATVVAGSAMFPRQRVIASLTKYAIPFDDSESTEQLRDKLAQFYAERTLTKSPILPDDQAAAILFLMGDEASRTTGQILAVDGGLHEAFLR